MQFCVKNLFNDIFISDETDVSVFELTGMVIR